MTLRTFYERPAWLTATLSKKDWPAIMSIGIAYTPPVLIAGTDDELAQPLPTETRFMPFSPANRMTTLLTFAVLLLCGMALFGVRVILRYPSANSTPAWVFLGGSILLALKILLAMLQTEFTRRDLKAESAKTRHDLKDELQAQSLKMDEVVRRTNGGLSDAVKEVGEQVRKAEHDQVLTEVLHRKEFHEVMEAIAAVAAKRACEEMQRNSSGGDGRVDVTRSS